MKTLILTGLSTFGCSKLPGILTNGNEVTVEDELADYLLNAHINPAAPEGTNDDVEPYFTLKGEAEDSAEGGDTADTDTGTDGDTAETDVAETEAPAADAPAAEAPVAAKTTQRVPRAKK